MQKTSPPPDLPGLPPPDLGMTWRSLNRFKQGERGEQFYLICLKYGQHLWRQRLPARAILCLDRAWAANLTGQEPALKQWPLPYQPLVDILLRSPGDAFLGNPRVHFQHYADRLGPPRREQRKWRSWACWALTRKACPDLPGDPKHEVQEPTLDQIEAALTQYGIPGETTLWLQTLSNTRPARRPSP